MKYSILVIVASLSLLSCKKETGTDPLPPGIPAETSLNVAYGTDPAQKMDVYLPANRSATSTKVIIIVHGGGWTQGDKTDFTPYVDTLKRRMPGYAIFNINYRLSTASANPFPAQELDMKAAVEFIYNRRSQYMIGDKFVLLGASAGGHLVTLQAYKYTPVIKAVVDFFGPTDLVDLYNNPPNPLVPPLLMQVTGGTPVSQPLIYQISSPLNYVTAQSPPTIILQGGADIVVSPSQSTKLRDKLNQFGVVNQFVYYPAEGHGWTGPNLADSFDKIAAFLNTNVN